jgi:hypothetical protein
MPTPAQAITALALPPKMRRLYLAICEEPRRSLRELTAACRFSSISVTYYWLQKLIALGLVRRTPGKARMLEVTEQ